MLTLSLSFSVGVGRHLLPRMPSLIYIWGGEGGLGRSALFAATADSFNSILQPMHSIIIAGSGRNSRIPKGRNRSSWGMHCSLIVLPLSASLPARYLPTLTVHYGHRVLPLSLSFLFPSLWPYRFNWIAAQPTWINTSAAVAFKVSRDLVILASICRDTYGGYGKKKLSNCFFVASKPGLDGAEGKGTTSFSGNWKSLIEKALVVRIKTAIPILIESDV